MGTFDTTLRSGWWISDGFTGVSTVVKGMQIYGSIHIALCKKTDGKWAIFRSENYAQTWTEVFTATTQTLYDMTYIIYGRVIVNASDGFYETVDSGLTWTKVSAAPMGTRSAAICNAGNGDILFATDGYRIWRSYDYARSWGFLGGMSNGGGSPAIAGANGVIIAAAGPYIWQSVDNGNHWEDDKYWSNPFEYKQYTGCDKEPYSSSGFNFKEILVSDINGPAPQDVTFVLRGDCTADNTTYIYAGGFYNEKRAYCLIYKSTTGILSPSSAQTQLSAYVLPRTGNCDIVDRAIVYTASKKDTTGKTYPAVKISRDGGWSWHTTNLTLVDFELPVDGNVALIDETFAEFTFHSGGCLNWGTWERIGGVHQRRLQSYDMDWVLQPYETIESPYDMRVKIEPPAIISIEYDMGLYALGRHLVPMLHDSLIEVTLEKPYLNTLILEQEHETSYQVDEITEVDRTLPYEMTIWLEKTSHKPYVMSYHTEVSSSTTYAMTAWFGQVTVPDIDWASPQWWNLIFPDSNRPPLDSRGVY